MSQAFSNNINSLNMNVNLTVADDRHNILCWLSTLDPKLRHKDIRDCRVKNVGEWVLQTEEFRSWCTGGGGGGFDNAVLFCYGGPGVGKTFISSLVIDSLCDQAGEQNATVACFYFDCTAQKEQTSTSTLGALLKQLVGGLEVIPEEISRAYQGQKCAIGGRGPQLSDIVKMLQTASSKKRTFICIDALDQCVAGHRARLLDSLNQILQKSPATRIFLTGRPQIRPEIGSRLVGRITSISITPKRDDITILRTGLGEDTTPVTMDSSLETCILKKIPDDISEMHAEATTPSHLKLSADRHISKFLFISLNIDATPKETTTHRKRQRLGTNEGTKRSLKFEMRVGRTKENWGTGERRRD